MMIKCRACKGEVDSSAKACPHCGAASPSTPGCLHGLKQVANAMIGLGMLAFLLLILAFCVGMV